MVPRCIAIVKKCVVSSQDWYSHIRHYAIEESNNLEEGLIDYTLTGIEICGTSFEGDYWDSVSKSPHQQNVG